MPSLPLYPLRCCSKILGPKLRSGAIAHKSPYTVRRSLGGTRMPLSPQRGHKPPQWGQRAACFQGCAWAGLSAEKSSFSVPFLVYCDTTSERFRPDPNADPYHAGSGRRHWSGEDQKAPAPGTNSTKHSRKRPLNLWANLRDQEAVGSNPATRTIGPSESLDFGGFFLVFITF